MARALPENSQPLIFTGEEGAIRIVEQSEQMQIDIFTVMSGKRFADALTDADRFELSGHIIPVASKRSLISWKEKSPREKDRLDAIALRQLLENPEALN